MTRTGTTIILLNGPGSVGKSSIARALQTIVRRPLLHVAMDVFLEMIPERYLGHPEGLVFKSVLKDGYPATEITSGPVVVRALHGMRRAVAALADAGNDLVVDDVLLGDGISEYNELLAPYRFLKVGITAPLEVLEQRERDRGDREIGLARMQVDIVHRGIEYDLMINSTESSPEDSARLICEKFDL
ncbi:MAG: chloramphenicol phosphotransferase [Alphaproteobacteria bacterium]|nr:chloramphenicol phosphotransferase [Alphaproteobacteria bacterium]